MLHPARPQTQITYGVAISYLRPFICPYTAFFLCQQADQWLDCEHNEILMSFVITQSPNIKEEMGPIYIPVL